MTIRYCIECAAELTRISDTEYICDQGHHFYNNPKAAVCGVLIKDNKALFSKRGISPDKGKYDLPGGFVEYGESAYSALRREMLEETTVTIGESRLIYTHTVDYIPNITCCDLVFVIHEWSGTLTAQDDSIALEWKPFDFLESDQFRVRYPGLQEILEHIALK